MNDTVQHFLYTSSANPNLDILRTLEDRGITWRVIDHLDALRTDVAYGPKILLLDKHLLQNHTADDLECLQEDWGPDGIFVCTYPEGEDPPKIPDDLIWGFLREPYHGQAFLKFVNNAFLFILGQMENERSRAEIKDYAIKLQELNRIGIALSSEREPERLLELILSKSREITNSDAGSLFLVENTPDQDKILRFKLTQNDSVPFEFTEITLPIRASSLVGYVALTGQPLNLPDVYETPRDAGYGFDQSFDRRTGYRTRSVLTIPMKNRDNETIAVLQLINRKVRRDLRLTDASLAENGVIPFDPMSEELASSLASQAAVSIENNILYQSIEGLFEGFVNASVTAIESRDPTTSGHSARVASLTVALAEEVDRLDVGNFRELHFSREQIRELRYACLLHDLGKVGVREQVLVKAKKLYPHSQELIKARFDFVKKALEAEFTGRKLNFLLEHGREQYLESVGIFERDLWNELEVVDDAWRTILSANEPTVLEEGSFLQLLEIAQRSYHDIDGHTCNLLTPTEVKQLSVRRGSLDEDERLEIESHVTHTFRFLSQIPWTRDLSKVPEIAYMHHEKLNGKGYPNRLPSPAIPVQSKMMAIADIYDALTASDRPYKKAVPLEKALDILRFEARDQHIDAELLTIFIEHRIFERGRILSPT
ncbi:Cyclic di-GMP phosphodiesterase response regulator RpfG [compost metagenome]